MVLLLRRTRITIEIGMEVVSVGNEVCEK